MLRFDRASKVTVRHAHEMPDDLRFSDGPPEFGQDLCISLMASLSESTGTPSQSKMLSAAITRDLTFELTGVRQSGGAGRE